MDDQLFQSTHAALTFAYNFQGSPALSVMNRMIKIPLEDRPPAKFEDWESRAAQAGIIRRHVHDLGKLHESIIVAEFSPRSQPCPCRSLCCSGRMRNQEWTEAMGHIADVVRTEALSEHRTTHPIRWACVEKFFGLNIRQSKIASDLDVNEHTLGQMIGKVRRYLRQEHDAARRAADNALDFLVIRV